MEYLLALVKMTKRNEQWRFQSDWTNHTGVTCRSAWMGTRTATRATSTATSATAVRVTRVVATSATSTATEQTATPLSAILPSVKVGFLPPSATFFQCSHLLELLHTCLHAAELTTKCNWAVQQRYFKYQFILWLQQLLRSTVRGEAAPFLCLFAAADNKICEHKHTSSL